MSGGAIWTTSPAAPPASARKPRRASRSEIVRPLAPANRQTPERAPPAELGRARNGRGSEGSRDALADRRRALDEPLLLEELERGERRGAGERMRYEGARVQRLAFAPEGLEQLGASDRRGDRHPAAERLAAAEQIGAHAFVLDCEAGAGAAEAGEDFVDDERHAVRATVLGERREPARRWHEHALASDHRLDDGRADRLGVEGRGDELVRGAERQPDDARAQRRRERRAELGARGHGERAERHAVVAGIEGEHSGASGRRERRLEGDLDRVGAGDGEVDTRVVDRREAGEALGERDAGRVRRDVAEAVQELAGLAHDRGDDRRMPVTDGGDAEAGGEVDEEIAVDVEDVRAERLAPDERRLAARADGRDARSFEGLEAAGEAAALGARRRDDDGGRKVPALEVAHRPLAGQTPTSRRPARERPSVTSSVYSMSPPTGMPKASRVTVGTRPASSRAR